MIVDHGVVQVISVSRSEWIVLFTSKNYGYQGNPGVIMPYRKPRDGSTTAPLTVGTHTLTAV